MNAIQVDDFSIQALLPKYKDKADEVYKALKGMSLAEARAVLDIVDFFLSSSATLTASSLVTCASDCEAPTP